VTAAPLGPVASAVILAGAVICGPVPSTTVILKLAVPLILMLTEQVC
jgi:hypothetical protein